MGERSINYFNSQFDTILIGKLLGTEALGIYTIAKNLVMKPAQIINPIITKVTFPIMAKIQNDTKQLKNIYLKTINYLCSVNFSIYMAIAVLAEPLVLLLFGDNWLESVVILQILSFYFMFRSIGNPIGSLQLAKGRADLGFYWNLGLFLLVPLAIYLGSFFGLVGVAFALLVLQIFLNFPNWFFMVRPLCGARFKEYFVQIILPLSIACISAGLSAIFIFYIGDIVLKILLFLPCFILFCVFINRCFKTEIYIFGLSIIRK